jgi:hypothetical protein
MSTAGLHLDHRHFDARDDGLTLNPREIDRLIDRHRAISAVEAKLAHLLDELGEEIEAEHNPALAGAKRR